MGGALTFRWVGWTWSCELAYGGTTLMEKEGGKGDSLGISEYFLSF